MPWSRPALIQLGRACGAPEPSGGAPPALATLVHVCWASVDPVASLLLREAVARCLAASREKHKDCKRTPRHGSQLSPKLHLKQEDDDPTSRDECPDRQHRARPSRSYVHDLTATDALTEEVTRRAFNPTRGETSCRDAPAERFLTARRGGGESGGVAGSK
jgi:hypothetical protein